MALSNVVDSIVSLLEQVQGIGKVLDYSRYAASERERLDTYVSGGVLHCWIVTRESTAAHDLGAGDKNVRDRHTITIEGYRAVASAADSERLHQEMAEAVRSALHNNRKLPSDAGWLSTPVQVQQFNSVMFFRTVLCWHAKLTVTAEEVMQGG
ncbi:MAG: hypothetical protein HYX72_00810 [Acidobacteria bacterium]|nr:hypothetical protein [Acidobacteriota bacterium]